MRYNPRLLIERNRLIANKIYTLLQEQPNINQAQLTVLVQQFIAKLANDSVPLLGSYAQYELDANSYPDAEQYNDTFQAVKTDFIDIASWHNSLLTATSSSVEQHLSKIYSEQRLIKTINLQLNALSLRTSGLSANEWAMEFELDDKLFESAQTTAAFVSSTKEVIGTILSEEKIAISNMSLDVVQPDSNYAKLGYGQWFGTGTGTDEAALAPDKAALINMTNDSETDYFEYEALLIEPLSDNTACPIAENHVVELQSIPSGVSLTNFYWRPVFKQVESKMPIGSALTDTAASRYQLCIRLVATLPAAKTITKLTIKQRPIIPGADFATIKAVAITANGSVAFTPNTAAPGAGIDTDGQSVLSIPPTTSSEIHITMTQTYSYKQRYQLNRAIVELSDGTVTNLLSDAVIG